MPDIRSSGGTYFLGRYRVVDEIGIGGMASVHLARMDGPGGFQKWVAIKKIHPHLVEDESFVQMFLDEARVAARISHPNVATVFDLGKHDDTYWIAMEYLHGEPLREVMRRTEELGTAMPPEIACRVIADAAEGLHAAHELLGKNGEKLGLVHRDVTPHNLFVTYDGVTKVVDFGIAKFSSRMSHTRAGTLKGKLAYMSPEQVHGEGIDRRTDIFALGVVLWELTTGQRLFRMESDLDTLAKVQECNVPRPSTLIRGYPVDLEKIVMKALAKNRGERFRTARELSRALQSLLMRRGLFIASDEVAAYVQSIFTDRIQKREAHLRWAAEVTQTINVEKMLSKPNIGPDYTQNSEVQAAVPTGKVAPVRPAAGAPPSAGPMPTTQQAAVPDLLKETGPSLPTAPRPVAPQIGVAQRGRPVSPPRPAAGAPPPSDEHPADGDGPTIQALPEMAMEESFTAARPPMLSEPPTMMGQNNVPLNPPLEGPTMMASPGARAAVLGKAFDDPSRSPPPIEPDEFEEDQDETIVANANASKDASPLHAPPTFPQPPAAGRMQAPLQPGPTARGNSGANRFGSTLGMPPPVQAMTPQGPSFPGPQPMRSGEVAFAETMGLQNSIPNTSPMGMGSNPPMEPDYGVRAMSQPPHDAFARGPNPTGPSDNFGIPRSQHPSHRMQPTVPRVGAVGTHDNRTMTAQRFKRRPPMWVVAALSCSIALLIAGVVIAILSTTTGPSPTPRATGSAGSGGSVTGAPSSGGTGPFTSARSAFNTVVTGGPGASATPPSAAPSPTPPVVDTATATAGVATPSSGTPPVATTAQPTPPATTATAVAKPTTQPTPPAPPATTAAAKPTSTPAKPAPTPAPAALGALTIVCIPKCDSITDNGQNLGPGHIFNRPVPAGRHMLALSAPNGAKKNLQVEVAEGQTREVRIQMDK
jgi:eukaryotic-like serine/threonine-protein kinase